MHPTQRPGPAVERLLDAQASTISRQQALGCGLSPKAIERFVRDGRWSRSARGVFIRGVSEPVLTQKVWTGILLAGEPAAVGGRAALHLLGVGEVPETLTIVVPRSVQRRLPLEYETLRDGAGRLGAAKGDPPAIRAEDALLDSTRGGTLADFVATCTELIRLQRTTAKQVESVLRLRERHPDRSNLLEVLADLQGIESNLEFVFREKVLRAHGLPEGVRQARTRNGRRIDVDYEEYGVFVELDGRRGHVEGRFRDYARDNEHTALLRLTFRYGSEDVREAHCQVALQLGLALIGRGWPGGLGRCAECPPDLGVNSYPD